MAHLAYPYRIIKTLNTKQSLYTSLKLKEIAEFILGLKIKAQKLEKG